MVKIEGTLDEIRELVSDVKRVRRSARSATKAVAKTAKATKRKLSKWQRYVGNKSNHIKFTRGPKKGRLDLAKMSKAFKRSKK